MRDWAWGFTRTGAFLLAFVIAILAAMSLTGLSAGDGWGVDLVALLAYLAGWAFIPLLLVGALLWIVSSLSSLCPRDRGDARP
jgi:hypothetical protein